LRGGANYSPALYQAELRRVKISVYFLLKSIAVWKGLLVQIFGIKYLYSLKARTAHGSGDHKGYNRGGNKRLD